MGGKTISRWVGLAAVLGGLLWLPHAVFEMLEPWGPATEYRDDLQYQLILDTPLFVAYSLPGALALLLTSIALSLLTGALRLPVDGVGRVGVILARIAAGLAVLSLAGIAVLFAPLFVGGLVIGSLALAAGTLMLGITASEPTGSGLWSIDMLLLGLLGLLMLPLRPLVYAAGLVPNWAGAAIIALFGLGWTALGLALAARGAPGDSVYGQGR